MEKVKTEMHSGIEEERRVKLYREKTLVYEKIMNYVAKEDRIC